MDTDRTNPWPLQILTTPPSAEVQQVADWLAYHPQQNPDLEIALQLILQQQVVLHQHGSLLAIAYTTPPASALTLAHIQGTALAKKPCAGRRFSLHYS